MDKLNGKELGEAFLDSVNSFSFNDKDFAEVVARGHRTLQQSAMRAMVALAKEISVNSYDDRNEASVTLAKKICEVAEDNPLPFI